MRKQNAGSPIFTNASINRKLAVRCFQAGMTAEEIAAEWPEVWTVKGGKLAQKYDYELADGSGRLETNRLITEQSVNSAIARAQGK